MFYKMIDNSISADKIRFFVKLHPVNKTLAKHYQATMKKWEIDDRDGDEMGMHRWIWQVRYESLISQAWLG